MANPIKNCKVCGKEFETSATGKTVNCPEHRGSYRKPKAKSYREIECCKCGTHFTELHCPNCGY